MHQNDKTMVIFGYGYVSKFLINELTKLGWYVYCTSRRVEQVLHGKSHAIINFSHPDLSSVIKSSHAILSAVPPNDAAIDPVLALQITSIISHHHNLKWVGYLSSTGVYGDHAGDWVNEQTICIPKLERSKKRLAAERAWLELYHKHNVPVHIFRLSGIYGPGRNCIEDITNGKDYTIFKQGHYFSRIHVQDICFAIITSLSAPTPGEVYNVADDEPSPTHVVSQFGASLLNRRALKEIALEEASISQYAAAFFQDNKRVNSDKIKKMLGIEWRYPNYRQGLQEGCLPYVDIL